MYAETSCCSRCGRTIRDDLFQTIPLSMYACRRVCSTCMQREGRGFGMTFMGLLLIVLLFTEVLFSLFRAINLGTP